MTTHLAVFILSCISLGALIKLVNYLEPKVNSRNSDELYDQFIIAFAVASLIIGITALASAILFFKNLFFI